MHPAYILSGGQSRRFGSDKSRYPTAHGPQLLHLVEQLRQAGHAVEVIADRADRYLDLGITCLVDTHPNCGPLAGLNAALLHHSLNQPNDGWLLLVNCDQWQWQSIWYDELRAAIAPSLRAIAYYDTLWQPLPGLYHRSLLDQLTTRLDSGERSFHALLDQLEQCSQALKLITAEPPSRWSFNTPDELPR